MPLFPMPPLKFRTAGFPQYGFKPEPLNYRLPPKSADLNATPISTHLLKVCHSPRLSTPDPCSLIQGNSVSAVTSSALCPLPPVYQTLPSLSAYLSPVATIHTPESVSSALTYSFPDTTGHHDIYIRLALSSFSTSIGFMWWCLTTLQCSLHAAAPGVAQLPCRPGLSCLESPTSFLLPSLLRIRRLLLSRILLPR